MLGAASSEGAASEDEVRSMLDPELSAALELLDTSGIQALLEDEGVVPPLQSACTRPAIVCDEDASMAGRGNREKKPVARPVVEARGSPSGKPVNRIGRAVCTYTFQCGRNGRNGRPRSR